MGKQRKVLLNITYNELGTIIKAKAEDLVCCKDCKHWDELLAMCKKSRRVMFGVKDFCSKAERRTDETD